MNPTQCQRFFETRELKLICYISKILFPDHPFYLYPLYMFFHYCRICSQKKLYSLVTVNETSFKQLKNEAGEDEVDENYAVIINNKFMKKSNNAILIMEYGGKIIRRIVKPIISKNIDSSTIFITKPFFFNITNEMKISCLFNTENSLMARIMGIPLARIGFANEINLALVNSPTDLDNAALDSLLKIYFGRPKLVCENDILEISLKNYLRDALNNMTKVFNIEDKIYFKCTKVLCSCEDWWHKSGRFVVLGETTVKQVANMQSFLPPNIGVNFYTQRRETKIMGICPNGLSVYGSEIERSIEPFLRKNLSMNPAFLITGKKGCGKETIISSIASKFGMHFYRITNFDITANVYAQNETKLKNIFFNAKLYAPCIIYMKNFENFEKNNEGQSDERIISNFTCGLKTLFENNKFPVILFCSSNEEKISVRLRREFLEIFKINTPTKEERLDMFKWLFQSNEINYIGDLEEVIQKTNTFLFEDLKGVIRLAKTYKTCPEEENNLCSEDLLRAIDYMQLQYNENIGAPKVPKVHWDDIGGLSDVKEEIIKTINFSMKHSQLLNSTGLRRSGILLFGPPGTGKTLLAKAVATECNLCFLSVKGPELLNMYIGQSEENIREVFERARGASPCIIFFDELDSLAPNRGVSGDSGGVMDRVVSQLLAEMDGLNEKATIFVIGATNRPDLIDPALLRPGRFDKLLYVGPAIDSASRLSVLKALTRKFNLSENVNLEDIVSLCPNNISGADFYGICSESWMHAVRRTIRDYETGLKDIRCITGKDIIVETEDFLSAISSTKPSVTMQDLMYFEKLKKEISSN